MKISYFYFTQPEKTVIQLQNEDNNRHDRLKTR